MLDGLIPTTDGRSQELTRYTQPEKHQKLILKSKYEAAQTVPATDQSAPIGRESRESVVKIWQVTLLKIKGLRFLIPMNCEIRVNSVNDGRRLSGTFLHFHFIYVGVNRFCDNLTP
jgi:hypothetical protein